VAKGRLITTIDIAITRPEAICAWIIAEDCLGFSAMGCDCSNLDEESAKFHLLRVSERPDASAAKKIYPNEI
jgi:hypothetical protein